VVVGQKETPTKKRDLGEAEILHDGRDKKLGIYRRSQRGGWKHEACPFTEGNRSENPKAYPHTRSSQPI